MSRIAVVTLNQIPPNPTTFKYDVLGELSLLNHRLYCDRHGYAFIESGEFDSSRPVCWSKLPAILAAMKEYEWVLWADSDTLVLDPDVQLERFCDSNCDLVVQYQEHWWELIGVEDGTARSPMNSGVFLIRSSPWSLGFLREAYAQTQFVTAGETWDGIGEQEAMNHLFRTKPEYREHIKYVHGLQTSPKLFTPGDFIVHFYGNHSRLHVPMEECAEVLRGWRRAIEAGWPLPDDLMRFHWCCIQNKSATAGVVWGDLEHFLYKPEDVMGRTN
jgi:hypothetical protein